MRRLIAAALAVVLGAALGVQLWAPGSAASLPLTSQALTSSRTCIITATPATTAIVADASVRQASSTSNYGSGTTDTIATAAAANRRLYLRFDLTQCSPVIPAGATVRLATLRLYASALPATCRKVDLFAATAAWSETRLTWANQPFGTILNSPPSTSASASFPLGTPSGCANRTVGTISVPVTADVAGFVAGTAPNDGWMLRDDVEGSATSYTATFSAKELGTPAQAPQLVVTYVTVP